MLKKKRIEILNIYLGTNILDRWRKNELYSGANSSWWIYDKRWTHLWGRLPKDHWDLDAKLNIFPTSHIATGAEIYIMKDWTTN